MNNRVDCDKCGREFVADEYRFGEMRNGDLVVQYLACPFCGERYHVFTSDSEMRKLVERRKAVQQKINIAVLKKFTRKTVKKYQAELEQIKKKQMARMPELKRRGEEILRNGLSNE